MAHFDRFDICEAWYLFHSNHSDYYTGPQARLRAMDFSPRLNLSVETLSENALEIYAQLCANAGTLQRAEHEIVNTRSDSSRQNLFRMWAGESQDTIVYVWAQSFDRAFEGLVEWLDDNAPGCLVSHADAQAALEEWQEENDTYPDADGNFEDDSVFEQVEQANDWTVIGHTTLKTGSHIPSHEWGGDEVKTGSDEYETVLLAGTGVEVPE